MGEMTNPEAWQAWMFGMPCVVVIRVLTFKFYLRVTLLKTEFRGPVTCANEADSFVETVLRLVQTAPAVDTCSTAPNLSRLCHIYRHEG